MPVFGLGKRSASSSADTGRKQPTAPRRVLADGDHVAAKLLLAAEAHDWSNIHDTLAGVQGRDLSALTATMCARSAAVCDWLTQVAADGDDDFVSRLVMGAGTGAKAWRVRTGARAQHVSSEQFTEFHALLKQAEEHLYEAAQLAPDAAAPWHFLIATGRGLEIGIEAIERRFEAVTTRCPGHFEAHFQMLQCLCKKWSGSHERMHAFAEEAIEGSHWSTLALLVPWAHLERYLDLSGGEPGREYLAQPKVLAEIREAADLTLGQPDYADPRAPFGAANLFAMAFSLARAWDEALTAFKRTEGVVTERPWNYLNGNDQKAPYAKFHHFATKLG